MPGIEVSAFGIGIFIFLSIGIVLPSGIVIPLSIGIATPFCLGFATSRFGIGIFMLFSIDILVPCGIFMPSSVWLWSYAFMGIVVPSGITIFPLEEPSAIPGIGIFMGWPICMPVMF